MGQGSRKGTRRAEGPTSPGRHWSTVTIAADLSSNIRTERKINVGFSNLEVAGDLDQKSLYADARGEEIAV